MNRIAGLFLFVRSVIVFFCSDCRFSRMTGIKHRLIRQCQYPFLDAFDQLYAITTRILIVAPVPLEDRITDEGNVMPLIIENDGIRRMPWRMDHLQRASRIAIQTEGISILKMTGSVDSHITMAIPGQV